MSQHATTIHERPVPSLKVWWLIIGRLFVSSFLLLISNSWSEEHFRSPAFARPSTDFLPILGCVLALSFIYALLSRLFPANSSQHVRLQLALDVFLVTWLVWLTGDVRSPYTALYIIIIALAGIYLGAQDALVASVGCSICYTVFTLLVVFNLVDSHGFAIGPAAVATTYTAEAVQKIGLNNIGFLVVGLLAARLSERQTKSDVQLLAATHALENLRALHERIIESMRSGIVTIDLAGNVYSLNTAAEEITGYRSSELKGRPVSLLFGQLEALIAHSLQTETTNEMLPRREAICVRPDGVRLHLGFSLVPLFAESGEATGFVITFQDLTGVRALEEQNRRQDRLAAVGRVAAGIAHEIRNPLAAMSGSIQVLRGELDGDASSKELMEIVLRESERLNRIITDFLLYARPRACDFALTDLREPLRETIALLRNSPEMKETHTIRDNLSSLPLFSQVDAAQLKQVFWNLSRNALQAMPDGGVFSINTKQESSGHIQLIFTDTGCGMTPEQRENLFEPFSSTKANGTGLGLSIVYQIIQDHHGAISIHSREGEGTTIIVKLPAAQVAATN